MDGPSYSLFHGGENIRVNTSDIDDEEALERHKSIEKGLNDFLGDDLLELDETESSIGHSHIYKHNDQRYDRDEQEHNPNPFYSQPNNNNNNYTPFSRNNQPMHNNYINGNTISNEELSRLKNALESKTREVDHINGLLIAERNRSDELEKRFKLSEAEKDRAFMQKKQFHELLVEAKGRSSELEEEISNWKGKIKTLESNNTKLECELDSTRTLLADCELKYRIIEKDAHTSRQVDGILKQENDRHTAQAYMMQQELSSLRNKLEDKELEVRNLQARYKELQKSRASIVEENSGVTSQLKREIDDYQRSTANTSQENLQLKKTIQSLERENSDLQQTIHQMTIRFDKTKSRNDSDRMSCSNQDESLDYFKKNRSSLVGSTPINTNNEINRLKKELDRCSTALNTSKYEVESLEKQLQSKIDENKQLKDDENNALVEMAHYKEECQRLNEKLCLLDSELKHGDALEHQKKRLEEFQDQIDDLQKMNDDMSDECAKLRSYNEQLAREKDTINDKYNDIVQKNESLKSQLSSNEIQKSECDKLKALLEDARKEYDELKIKYGEVSAAKDRVVDELSILKQNDVHQELLKQNEQVSSLERALTIAERKYSDLERQESKRLQEQALGTGTLNKDEMSPKSLPITCCAKCIDNKTLITKLEVENVEMKNSCANHLKEIADLKESIKNLSSVVEMKKEYDVMLNELKIQAKEFSELVHTHNTKYTTTSEPVRPIESRDQSVSTTPDIEFNSEPATRREIELKMSKIMSEKIKRLESESKEQMQEINRSVELLTGELQRALSAVRTREKEVELLKLTLLAERKASSERLYKMQVELNSNHQIVLSKLINENEMLKKDLEDKNDIDTAERESVELLKKQWQDTEYSLLRDIKNLKTVIGEFEEEKSQIIKRLNKKYESAVKRGDNYRDYADAKEQHIISESARIKDEYQNKLSKMQTKYLEKLESILKEKEKEHTDRIIKLEEEWRTRLENYQTEFYSNNADK